MKTKQHAFLHFAFSCILLLSLCSGYASANDLATPVPDKATEISRLKQMGFLAGYLKAGELPDSLILLPPPPAPGSTAFALDEDVARRTFAVRGTARFTQALSDYDMSFPHATGAFSCALNAPITPEDTPRLYNLLRRTVTDTGHTDLPAKDHYKRQRPFVLNKEPICAPQDMAKLEKDGSYPSGHTTVGWAWALILTEISPAQTEALLVRARTFGESRNVCNHHWYSDVEWGRTMGAATVARLHASPEFLADLQAAKAEIAAARSKGLSPSRNCSEEAAALAIKPY